MLELTLTKFSTCFAKLLCSIYITDTISDYYHSGIPSFKIWFADLLMSNWKVQIFRPLLTNSLFGWPKHYQNHSKRKWANICGAWSKSLHWWDIMANDRTYLLVIVYWQKIIKIGPGILVVAIFVYLGIKYYKVWL